MPSPGNQSPENRRIDWMGITRILLVQVLVLLALSWAFIRYVDWSSDQAWAEFSAADKTAAPAARSHPPSPTPLRTVRDRAPCRIRI